MTGHVDSGQTCKDDQELNQVIPVREGVEEVAKWILRFEHIGNNAWDGGGKGQRPKEDENRSQLDRQALSKKAKRPKQIHAEHDTMFKSKHI